MSDANGAANDGTLAEPAAGRARVTTSRGFCHWMMQQTCSLLITTYQTGQLCCIGTRRDGQLSFQQAGYARTQGLCTDGQTVWLAVQSVLWRLENALQPGERTGHHDRLFEPRVTYITGDLDIHELATDRVGQVVFVNTKYSCLATVSQTHNFKQLWKPAFISALAPEDRCHLNGLAMENGEARYVTALSQTDTADGWRARSDTGVLIDVAANRIVADGLWLPNSPRVHGGKIWLLESGRGQIVTIDPATGAQEDIAFCPGFLRGLAFHRHFALVTVSLPRQADNGLPLDAALKERGAQRRCGVFIVDVRTGALIEWLSIEGLVTELFEIAVLPDVQAAMADGPGTPGLGSRQIIEPV